MAIEILSAMLAKESYGAHDGKLHIVSPVTSLTVPKQAFEEVKATGKKGIQTDVNLVAVLVLWGGSPDEQYTLTAALTGPTGKTVAMPVQHKVWAGGDGMTGTINIDATFQFNESGLGMFKFKFLLNGTSRAEIRLPILKEGDAPPS